MDEYRLPKQCYLHQLDEICKGNICWAGMIKATLRSLDLHEMWDNIPSNINEFRIECTKRLVKLEWDRLKLLALQYPSLTPLRTVQSLVRHGDPIVAQSILGNREKLRWIIMTLLSCPGSLVRHLKDLKVCSICEAPIDNIFTHLVAFCVKTQVRVRRDISTNIQNLIINIQSDPGSAASTLTYWLFLSEDRFRVQQDYVALLSSL